MQQVFRVAALLAAVPTLAFAQQQTYRDPPAPIPQILDAAPLPFASVGPDRQRLLLLERRSLPTIAEVAGPELRLAGVRIDPQTNGPSRSTGFDGLRLRAIRGATEREIQTPADARIGSPQWSPDGRHVAFTVTGDSSITLWVAEVATGASRRIGDVTLNATLGTPCEWLDASALLCRTVPAGRGAPPARAPTPVGPVVQQTAGRVAPARTYQDLLESPHDEALFDHYFTDQLAVIGLDGSVRPIGEPGIHGTASPSPDGRMILVETVHRPYSYLVPVYRFPQRVEVWDAATGRVVKTVADLPLQEEIPTAFDAVPTGPRNVRWRADAPATLVWAEALDQGDPSKAATKRDRVMMLAAPFTGEPQTLLDVDFRVDDVIWSGRPNFALVTEEWWKTRQARTWVVNPATPAAAPRLLLDYSTEDRYNDPGRFIRTVNDRGESVLLLTPDGRSAYLEGQGGSPEGDRPFLDRIDLATGRTQRLWRSAAPHYEEVVTLVDPQGRYAVTRRESVTDVPNYYLRDVRSNRLTQLTNFADPAPQFAGVTKQLITYTRDDGVELSGTLYLPAGYDSTKGPLPFLLWAYPREFRSARAASQVVGSPYRFTRPGGSSHLFLLTQGYGILDGPTMPIVGEGRAEPNDTYVEQLVASAKAAVDKIVAMGVADRDRIAIGGHSYGAFMTANLLAHSDLFTAGIARSGAYNRTLTPFGFQAEEREFWKARDIYMRMSPFTYANQINEPVLLIHGMADNNSGTFPIQSERLYAAIKGNGGTARLVMLPAESHGYAARQSIGHVLWEMVEWLDTHVKERRQISDQ